jgi:hypothetical protein
VAFVANILLLVLLSVANVLLVEFSQDPLSPR